MPKKIQISKADIDLYQLLVAERELLYLTPHSEEWENSLKTYNKNFRTSKERLEKDVFKKESVEAQKLKDTYLNSRKKWIFLTQQVVELSSDIATQAKAAELSFGKCYEAFDIMEDNLDIYGGTIEDQLVDIQANAINLS